MTTKYINAAGELKEAELSAEQVEKLKAKGVQVIEAKKPRIHVSDTVCEACSG
jgi:hypothetical protein